VTVVGSIDWTTVLVAGLAGVPATVAAVLSFVIHRHVSTPSGDAIGQVVERAHDMTAATLTLSTEINKRGLEEEGK
jgi:hypothetical protein